jgi:hypothetical protein
MGYSESHAQKKMPNFIYAYYQARNNIYLSILKNTNK